MTKKLTRKEAEELLKRYRMGLCTEWEKQAIEHWYYTLNRSEEAGIDASDARQLDEIRRKMFAQISNKIDWAEADRHSRKRPAVRRLYSIDFRTLSRIAAVLVVCMGVGAFLYKTGSKLTGNSRVSSMTTDQKIDGLGISVATTSEAIYLSDGTVVWLRDNSKLEYPKSFSGELREVRLSGEAFFDVAPDKEKPFIIHAPHFTTRVVGTSFNIKAYGNRDAQEVLVVTGKVVVSLNGSSRAQVKELVLRPNQKAVYSRSNYSFKAVVQDPSVTGALKRSKLAFDEVSLAEISNVLNAYYDVNISFEDSNVKNCVITADLTDESLEIGIAILAKAINASYTIIGRDIIIHGKGCGVQP